MKKRLQVNAACKAARFARIPEQRCAYYSSFNKSINFFILVQIEIFVDKRHLFKKFKKDLYDIEELVNLGKKETFCPYFLERELKDKGDLVLLPYNYLMDGRVRDMLSLDIAGSILIYDEAHNIEHHSEDGCSFTLTLRDLEDCELDFKLLRQKIKQDDETKLTKITHEDVDLLEFPILNLTKAMNKMKKEWDGEKRKSNFSFSDNVLLNLDHHNNKFGENSKGKVEPGRNFFHMFKEMTKGKDYCVC